MKYAAYGSNLHPERLQQRTGPVELLGTGRVEGLALRFHKRGNIDGSGKCNVIEQAGSSVYMAVFELPDSSIKKLDEAEGLGTGYEHGRIYVPDHGVCMTYYAQAKHIDDSLLPFDWYKDMVLAGCRFHRFPDDYIREIEAIPAVTDPDPDRHSMNTDFLSRLT